MSTTAQEQQRRTNRQAVLKGAAIVFGNTVIDCVVTNVSEAGMRVRTGIPVAVPEHVRLRLNGGAVYAARRRWAHGVEIGFELERTAALSGEPTEMAWQAYERVRTITLEETLRLLGSKRFFDDYGLQRTAEQAEAGLRRLEEELLARAKRPQRAPTQTDGF